MIGNYINAVGLELEGPFRTEVKLDEKYVGDFKNETFNHPVDHPEAKLLKECVSKPLWYKKHVEEFFNIAGKSYIEEAVTPGMGFHIHFSLSDQKYYDILFSKRFVAEFQKELFKLFKEDEKLQARPAYRSPSGTNFYQMVYPKGYFEHGLEKKRHDVDRTERYYFINFWRAFRDHGTFEIRIFPATTIKQMKAYLEFTTTFIENYIKENINDDEVHYTNQCDVERIERERRNLYCGKRINDDTNLIINRRN